MAGKTPDTEQLRDFLRPLKPEVRAQLVGELERSLLRGDEIPGCHLVLNELRRLIRQSGDPLPRVGNPQRLFFRTFEPFLVDDARGQKQGNYIARSTLTPLWNWICEKLVPADAQSFCRLASAALLAGYADKAEGLTREFQNLALKRMQETLASARGDESTGRRLAGEIGTPRGLEDLKVMIDILKARDAIGSLRALAEIERVIDRIQADPADPAIGQMLKNIPNFARGLPARLDVPADSPWGRQLTAIRGELSNRLRTEIASLPDRVLLLLEPRPSQRIAAGSVLNPREVAEMEAMVEFARTCGVYATQLHLQQTIWKALEALRNFLKTVRPALLEALRSASQADRNFRHSQLAAAVRICAKVIDGDYAAQFAKEAGLSVETTLHALRA
jgi:hypothetical protein